MMGGVHTDIHGATPLAGLYRGGRSGLRQHQRRQPAGIEFARRVAGVRQRRGRAVGDAVYRRARATATQSAILCAGGRRGAPPRAAVSAQDRRHRAHREASARDVSTRWRPAAASTGERDIADRFGRTRSTSCRSAFSNIAIDDHARTFNTQLTSALELGFMLDVAETIVHCALNREESRGAHQRRDFPKRDDRSSSPIRWSWRNAEGPPRIDYRPVVITRWPPGERVYGR